MKKYKVLLLPLLSLIPLLFFNFAIDLWAGTDLTYPDYYHFYPFPTQKCAPKCQQIQSGIIASIAFWIIAYNLYLHNIKKSKYELSTAYSYTILIGVIGFVIFLTSSLYIQLFISEITVGLNAPDTDEHTYCQTDQECWCQSFTGAEFIPGKKVPNYCNLKTNRYQPCLYY